MIHTGAWYHSLAKGTANLVTFGAAYPKSGPLGNEGSVTSVWGLLGTEIRECMTNEYGERVDDPSCPGYEPPEAMGWLDSPSVEGPCCPTGLYIKEPGGAGAGVENVYVHGLDWDRTTVAGVATPQTIHKLAVKKGLQIEQNEGAALKKLPLLNIGLLTGPEAPPAPALSPPRAQPPVVKTRVEKRAATQTAMIAGGAALAAFLLIRGLRS